MIRSLCGEVLSVTETNVVLDVNGLGFDINASRGALSLCSPGDRVRLTAWLQISEAGVALFGFADEAEREIFLKITTIKGIGGRTAMAVLSVLSAEEIVRAVSMADVDSFVRVPGVGRKTAERICFELKNSLSTLSSLTLPQTGEKNVLPGNRVVDTVGDALRSLGFSQGEAASALALVRAAQGEDYDKMDEESLLRAALKALHRKQ
ncbi:MAG: Holliday junction branch migration protein RuvA [Synergistaceae bacterium]|jgi:Holliday junction DNA helicase RuvA|nr:Holliday junction branch migration protein RuvA [Synergistaceae bacterium]